jgi:hypothetical protein
VAALPKTQPGRNRRNRVRDAKLAAECRFEANPEYFSEPLLENTLPVKDGISWRKWHFAEIRDWAAR